MRRLIPVILLALAPLVPSAAWADDSCDGPPPVEESKQQSPTVETPAGDAQGRGTAGSSSHVGVTVGTTYLFADGNPSGGGVVFGTDEDVPYLFQDPEGHVGYRNGTQACLVTAERPN